MTHAEEFLNKAEEFEAKAATAHSTASDSERSSVSEEQRAGDQRAQTKHLAIPSVLRQQSRGISEDIARREVQRSGEETGFQAGDGRIRRPSLADAEATS